MGSCGLSNASGQLKYLKVKFDKFSKENGYLVIFDIACGWQFLTQSFYQIVRSCMSSRTQRRICHTRLEPAIHFFPETIPWTLETILLSHSTSQSSKKSRVTTTGHHSICVLSCPKGTQGQATSNKPSRNSPPTLCPMFLSCDQTKHQTQGSKGTNVPWDVLRLQILQSRMKLLFIYLFIFKFYLS